MKLKFKFGYWAVALIIGALGILFDQQAYGVAVATTAVLPLDELKSTLGEIKTGVDGLKNDQLEGAKKIKALEDEISERKKEWDEAQKHLTEMRKHMLSRGGNINRVRMPGFVTDECARGLASMVILGMARKGQLDGLENRDALIKSAREFYNLEAKATLTTSDIPFPTEFTQQMKELVLEYGVVRKAMSPYPIGRGTSRPMRLGSEDNFGFIAKAVAIGEKTVQVSNASLESHKVGGIVRYPREIEEQGIADLGQLLARYAARKFAKIEDEVAFLADGTGTYESIAGISNIATANSRSKTLSAGKTSSSDATLEDLRALRGLVKSPIIGSGKYYLHITWETRLRTFNSAKSDTMIYVQNGPMGTASLDGYEIVWTEVLTPYSTGAQASSLLATFGDLSYWWFGQHGQVRTDFSADVFFTTDELAVRFLEEIDFDYADEGCASVLLTPAA